MADAILYSSMDPAGPGLRPSNNAASNALAGVQRTFDILHACLVTGYGVGPDAKPGQGWVVVHSDLPNIGFTLRAPDGVFYVFYKGPNTTAPGSSAGNTGVQLFMAENLTAPFTYPPTGTNVRSLDFASSNPGVATRHWVSFSNSTYGETKWFLIARGSQVLFMRDNFAWEGLVSDSAEGASVNTSGMVFFGNVLLNDPTAPRTGPQASIFQGGYQSSDTETSGSAGNRVMNHMGDWALIPTNNDTPSTTLAACTRLRDLLTGAVEAATLSKTSCNPAKYHRITMARNRMPTLPPDLRLEQVDVWLAGVGAVGKVPGLFYGGRSCHYHTQDLMISLGKGGALADCLTPVDIGGEPFHILPVGFGSVLVSLQEKYWQ